MPEQLGDLDFYPNGGAHQPGCRDACVGIACLEINMWDLFKGACSHSRAHHYYVESIEAVPIGDRFISKGCDSWEDFEQKECHDQVDLLPMGEGLTIEM